jgi:phenolic acid decarboxylase
MIGMDFLSLINLVRENREKYVLLVVCYFTKIVFVKAYVLADLATIINL